MSKLQQSLIVKQDEVTRLNQEGARLVGELSHAQKKPCTTSNPIAGISSKSLKRCRLSNSTGKTWNKEISDVGNCRK
ncbi:hypothetical protein ACFS07_34625 [Undibacterium arcticum]